MAILKLRYFKNFRYAFWLQFLYGFSFLTIHGVKLSSFTGDNFFYSLIWLTVPHVMKQAEKIGLARRIWTRKWAAWTSSPYFNTLCIRQRAIKPVWYCYRVSHKLLYILWCRHYSIISKKCNFWHLSFKYQRYLW